MIRSRYEIISVYSTILFTALYAVEVIQMMILFCYNGLVLCGLFCNGS